MNKERRMRLWELVVVEWDVMVCSVWCVWCCKRVRNTKNMECGYGGV